MAINIIFLGPPGSGKGTQAALLSDNLRIPKISTGDILREEIKNNTQLGIKAKQFIDSGTLVPDDVMLAIISARTSQDDCKSGFILDGFPRTVAQANGLSSLGIKIDKVININLSDEIIVERLGGRRICASCGSMFHIKYQPPKNQGICDKCGAMLVIRVDDKVETIKKRLKVYHSQTQPLIEYYKKKVQFINIDGNKSIDEIKQEINKRLEEAN